jgi:predicted phage terminase large subunit-like protein
MMARWDVVYEKAIREDGSLFFPQKLTKEFLDGARRTMGSYLFANQYMNEVIPADAQSFKKEWFKYYSALPKRVNTFIQIDPAISQQAAADYTGVVVVSVDPDNRRYVRFARRYKITPTEIVQLVFKLNEEFQPAIIGVEDVAYQKALLYFLDEEMRRRNVLLPVKGVKPPNDRTKEMKILGMVPRFEWGHMMLSQGLHDLEMELLQFPRGAHDDLIDALASMDAIIYPPDRERENDKQPNPANVADYERWYIRQLQKRQTEEG